MKAGITSVEDISGELFNCGTVSLLWNE